jgi:hypothetical protein
MWTIGQIESFCRYEKTIFTSRGYDFHTLAISIRLVTWLAKETSNYFSLKEIQNITILIQIVDYALVIKNFGFTVIICITSSTFRTSIKPGGRFAIRNLYALNDYWIISSEIDNLKSWLTTNTKD